MSKNALILFFLVLFWGLSCGKKSGQDRKVERSFYYWKTVFDLAPEEKQVLKQLEIKRLYVRMFDVDWNESEAAAVPKGKLVVHGKLPEITIVPVIYITNKTFRNLQGKDLTILAQHCVKETNSILEKTQTKYKELQIDCDWSDKTRKKYFKFLEELKLLLPEAELSSTIRLHQVKYYKVTGVPPVKRGMLMFYNMGKLSATEERNSIFNEVDAAKYTASIRHYPLPLDVVLPTFEWCLHIRNNRILGLINKGEVPDFTSDTLFVKQGDNKFLAQKSYYTKGRYIKRGDLFKLEKISKNELISASEMMAGELKPEKRIVALFDLDKVSIVRYDKEVLEKVFNLFD